MRYDVASNGPNEKRVSETADFVRCDVAPDGSWAYTYDWQGITWLKTSTGSTVNLGLRNGNNPHYVRWATIPYDGNGQTFVLTGFYILKIYTPDGKVNKVSRRLWSGGITYVLPDLPDEPPDNSQGILDVTPTGTIQFWPAHTSAVVDGCAVRDPLTRGDYTICVFQDTYVGASVFVHSTSKWYHVYSGDIQGLVPRIAENGTAALGGVGFVTKEEWLTRPFDPHHTDPPPPIEDHMIAYGPLMKDWLLGDTSTHADGAPYVKVTKPNGKVLCVTPDGNVEEREVAGPWERFEKRGNALVAERELHGKPVVYVFPLA